MSINNTFQVRFYYDVTITIKILEENKSFFPRGKEKLDLFSVPPIKVYYDSNWEGSHQFLFYECQLQMCHLLWAGFTNDYW